MSTPMATAIPVSQDLPVDQGHSADTADTPVSASAPPAFGRSPQTCTPFSEDQMQRLMEQGYSRGLAKSLESSKKVFSHRFWIVDNSDSMQKCDGHRMIETKNRDTVKMVTCSRWEEIQECVNYHIQLSGLLQTPTRFRLLNDPGAAVGPQKFDVAEENPETISRGVQAALKIMRSARPGGVTPLTNHILEIHREISAMAPSLRASGQKVTIQIATDGMPSDKEGYSGQNHKDEFAQALRGLEGLPVWVVIRLCTDEENVVDFYNDLDQILELSMEVLDDFTGEAKEVHEYNPWLNYALPIHRMREMGFHDRVFDLLDERKLTKSELRDFCSLLFGEENMDGMADPNVEWSAFVKDVDRLLKQEKQQWNPMKKRMKPWIDLRTLEYMYGDHGSCAIM